VDNTSGASEPDWLQGVRLQPNPTTGFTRVVFTRPASGDMQISIFDATGRLLRQQHAGAQQTVLLDASAFPAGAYTVRFSDQTGFGVRKWIVLR
ncbi:MAG: T9SS type A sorting domain-containing protein, partial [Saprospiraceae bacterium]|nr:T9SS type A sorting domain-containing protein [Saprospiraceae bacterium]